MKSEIHNKKNKPPVPYGILRSHVSSVNTVKFLDNNRLISGSGDGFIKLWDESSHRCISSYRGHGNDSILKIDYLSDGKLASQGRDGLVKIWDVERLASENPESVTTIVSGGYTFCKFASMRWLKGSESQEIGNCILIPTSSPSTANLVDLRTKNSSLNLQYLDKSKTGMCMTLGLFASSERDRIDYNHAIAAIGYEDGRVVYYDIRSGGRVLLETHLFNDPVMAWDINESGNTAICASSGKDILAVTLDYSKLDSKSEVVFQSNVPGYADIKIRHDQRIFATAGWDRRIRIFSMKKLKQLAILRYHDDSVYGLDFKGTNGIFASCSKDKKVALWSIYPPKS